MTAVRLAWLGRRDYEPVLDLQRRLQQESRTTGREWILAVEHTPVYTLGRAHATPRLRVARAVVDAAGIPIVETERGGDITYHGPGQAVVYAILNLRQRGLGAVDLVKGLEDAAFAVLKQRGIGANRDERNRGAWVGGRKIASIGISVRGGVSMHGIALNVDPDMGHFALIDACGMGDVEMTSISRETGSAPGVEAVAVELAGDLASVLGLGELERVAAPE